MLVVDMDCRTYILAVIIELMEWSQCYCMFVQGKYMLLCLSLFGLIDEKGRCWLMVKMCLYTVIHIEFLYIYKQRQTCYIITSLET